MKIFFQILSLSILISACSGTEANFSSVSKRLDSEDAGGDDSGAKVKPGNQGGGDEVFQDICETNPKDPSCFTEKGEALRNVSFNLTTKREIPLVKTVLIVDNSNSMREEQSLLASGISTLVDKLKGLNVDLYLYTTTQFPANYSENEVANGRLAFTENTTINENGEVIEHGATANRKAIARVELVYEYIDSLGQKVTTSTKPSLNSVLSYDVNFRYDLLPNLFAYSAPLSIRTMSSDSDVNNVRAKLINTINSLGTTGSDREAGLCSLIRLVYEQGQNKIFNQGDNVAFVLLTDQDDQSDLSTCLPSRKVTVQLENYTAASNQDTWTDCRQGQCVPTHSVYKVKRAYNSISFSCTDTENIDGVLISNPANKATSIYSCGYNNHCQSQSNVNCNATQLGIIASNTGFSQSCRNSISSCKVTNYNDPNAIYHWETFSDAASVDPVVGCQRMRDKWQANAAHVFDFDTCVQTSSQKFTRVTTYTSATRVKRTGITKELNYFSDAQKNAVTTSYSKAALIDTFVDKSKELFGENGFLFSAIMRDEEKDQAETCPTQNNNNQAWGQTYRALVAKLGSKGLVQSICAADYSPALERVEDFIKTVTDKTHHLTLAEGEKVHKVFRTREGVKTPLVMGTDVKVVGYKLEFVGDMQSTDNFEVQILKP